MFRAEKRRMPRIAVDGVVRVRLEPALVRVTLADVSSGGFLAACEGPLDVGEAVECRFDSPDGLWSVILSAHVVHCHRRSMDQREPLYSIGFAFTDVESPESEARIGELLERAIGLVTID